LDEEEKRLAGFFDAVKNGVSPDTSPQLFTRLLKAYPSEIDGSVTGLADVISAANQANAQTRLASLCAQQLPAFLAQAGKNSQTLRTNRLEAQREIQVSAARARELEAMSAVYAGFKHRERV
jgi:hypothetical protein